MTVFEPPGGSNDPSVRKGLISGSDDQKDLYEHEPRVLILKLHELMRAMLQAGASPLVVGEAADGSRCFFQTPTSRSTKAGGLGTSLASRSRFGRAEMASRPSQRFRQVLGKGWRRTYDVIFCLVDYSVSVGVHLVDVPRLGRSSPLPRVFVI